MPKDRVQYYMFDGGVNKRDNVIADNELRDSYNWYWEGSRLVRRKGYAARCATLDISSVYPTGAVLKIVDHLRYKWDTTDTYFLFVSIDTTGGSTANKIVVFYNDSGIPSSAVTFTPLGSSYALDWDTSKPFSVSMLKDKVYIGTGKGNPYVLYWDSAWKVKELPVGTYYNDGVTTGAGIIPNGASDDWSGVYWTATYDHFLYISDKKTVYFAITDEDVDPAKNIASTDSNEIFAGIHNAWDITWLFNLDPNADISKATTYRNYLFMYGTKGVWSFYNRFSDSNPLDYTKDQVSSQGVYGEMLVTPRHSFWVSDDNIYGYDGNQVVPLGKKIWSYVKEQNTIPSGLADCSVAYHGNLIYISFPNATQKEIFVFEPDYIYSDESGDTYAPFYPLRYNITDLLTRIGFTKLKTLEGRLFAVSDKLLYELDSGYMDNGNLPIETLFKSSYFDQEAPAFKKRYGKSIIETNANIDSILDFSVVFSRDYGEDSSTAYTLDTTYTGNQRSYNELSVPYTIDGNSISLEITGDGTGKTGTGAVYLFGFSLEYEVKRVAKKEQ